MPTSRVHETEAIPLWPCKKTLKNLHSKGGMIEAIRRDLRSLQGGLETPLKTSGEVQQPRAIPTEQHFRPTAESIRVLTKPNISAALRHGPIAFQMRNGWAELAHSDFLKKVPQVLGVVAGNFSSYYVASNDGLKSEHICRKGDAPKNWGARLTPRKPLQALQVPYQVALQVRGMSVAQVQAMTSKEMADLTEKHHDRVKRTIDTLAYKGVIGLPQIVETSSHKLRMGQTANLAVLVSSKLRTPLKLLATADG